MDTTDKRVANAAKLFDALQKREDYWVNSSTGVGTSYDRHRNMRQAIQGRPSDDELEAYYIDNDIAATVVDKVPEEAMRQGYSLTYKDENPGEAAEIVKWAEDEYQVAKHVLQADKWARLFGGAGILYGANNGQELYDEIDFIEKGPYEVEFLRAVSRKNMDTAVWYDHEKDILSDKFGKPEVYRVTLKSGGAPTLPVEMHESRFHIIQGIITTQERFVENKGWGDSVLTRVIDILKRFDGSWMSIMHIITDSSVPVYYIKEFMALLESDQFDALLARMQLIDQRKNNMRPIILDADGEKYERVAAELTDVAAVLQNTMIRMSAAAKLPVSILFGQAPAGLNASPEGDLRNFYDKVDVERKDVFRPALLDIYRVLLSQKSSPTKGRVPENLTVEFPSLWQADPMQAATLYQMMSTADGVYIANQVMEPEEVAVYRTETAQAFGFPHIDIEARKALLELISPDSMVETLPNGMPGGKNLPSNAVRRRGEGAEETGAPAALTVENEPQKASLTGAQIKVIEELALKVGEGLLPKSSAKAIIMASFPIDEAAVDAILEDIDDVYNESSPEERAEIRARPFGGINPANDGVVEEGEEVTPEEEEEAPAPPQNEEAPPEEAAVQDALTAWRQGKDVTITILEPANDNGEADAEPQED